MAFRLRVPDPLRTATVREVSGNNCSITFDGVSVIKRVPVIGDPRLIAPGRTVAVQFIDNRYVVLATGMADSEGSMTLASASGLFGGGGSSSSSAGTTTPPPSSSGEGGFTFGQVILFHVGVATEYASLLLALAAAASDDTVWVPPSTQVGDVTVPEHVTVVGVSLEDSIIVGTVTLRDGSTLENLSIVLSSSASDAECGVCDYDEELGLPGISAALKHVNVTVSNDAGPAYCVRVSHEGSISAYDTELLAETGTDGYAVYAINGEFYHYGGRAIGTTELLPYYVE